MSTDRTEDRPSISLLGTTAILFQAPGSFDLGHQRRIWSLAQAVGTWRDVQEAIPGMTNLMVTFATPPRDIDTFEARLIAAWDEADPLEPQGRVLDVAVVYGGDEGPHLGDVAACAGLSYEEVVAIHCGQPYVVFALGSHPGYCYLGDLDPRLFVPRRTVPLASVPAGSVSVAGRQTGVSASAGPSGWHTIGRADVAFFDPAKEQPALLSPGDIIRFHPERVIR